MNSEKSGTDDLPVLDTDQTLQLPAVFRGVILLGQQSRVATSLAQACQETEQVHPLFLQHIGDWPLELAGSASRQVLVAAPLDG